MYPIIKRKLTMFNGQYHWMMDGAEWMWGMHGAGWMLWTLLLVGVILWVTRTASSGVGSGDRPPAMDRLQRAYAEGNLSTDAYEERKASTGFRP